MICVGSRGKNFTVFICFWLNTFKNPATAKDRALILGKSETFLNKENEDCLRFFGHFARSVRKEPTLWMDNKGY